MYQYIDWFLVKCLKIDEVVYLNSILLLTGGKV
jgi:hypothetical protein